MIIAIPNESDPMITMSEFKSVPILIGKSSELIFLVWLPSCITIVVILFPYIQS